MLTRAASLGVNWWVYTLSSSPYIHAGSPRDVRGWSFVESFEARIAHDALAEVAAIGERRSREERS